MKAFRVLVMLVIAMLLVLGLSACGGGDPAPLTMDNLPLFSNAKVTTDATMLQLSDAMTKAMESSTSGKLSDLQTKAYVAGKDTKWEAVQAYYDGELKKSNWQDDPQLTFNDPTVHGKAWIRGKQVMLVFFAADAALPDSVLLVMLGTAK